MLCSAPLCQISKGTVTLHSNVRQHCFPALEYILRKLCKGVFYGATYVINDGSKCNETKSHKNYAIPVTFAADRQIHSLGNTLIND